MNLVETINAYQPSDDAIALLRSTPVVLLAGITGSGRDTIVGKLIEKGDYFPYVTSTTRAMRNNDGVSEQNGVEYYFNSEEDAARLLADRAYVEVSAVHAHVSGLTVDELQRAHDSGKIALSDVSPGGVTKFKKLSPEVIAIFVVPPSYEAWLQRAKARYDNDEDFWKSWPPRRASALKELQNALDKPYYHFVVNDALDDAVEACHQIAHSNNAHSKKDDEVRAIVMELLEKIEAQI